MKYTKKMNKVTKMIWEEVMIDQVIALMASGMIGLVVYLLMGGN